MRRPADLALRPAGAADAAFLLALFASTRERELAHLPGGEAARKLFIRLQYAAQSHSYRSAFPDATLQLIALQGMPAGRMIVDRSGAFVHLVDLSLLPAYRNRGLGTALLRALLAEAAAGGRALRLQVDAANPAARLYERLGFEPLRTDGFHRVMEARAASSGK